MSLSLYYFYNNVILFILVVAPEVAHLNVILSEEYYCVLLKQQFMFIFMNEH